ncbi:MAG: hypothetical protein JNJ73_05445 [Hyphomonadaceae bacterium]|nr:hypothetical protein [Hyphomonadaceae bacterium]
MTLAAFEAGALDPATFDHRAHVEVAIALLRETDFLDAAARYQRGIEKIAAKAGAPHKANVTITLAFLSLIAERLDGAGDVLAAHPELLEKTLLTRWYAHERLCSPLARRVLLLP